MLAVGAVLAPLDVHRAAIVLLDHQGVARELLDFGIGQRVAVALLQRHVDGLHQLAASPPFPAALANTIWISLEPRLRRITARLPAASMGLCT